MSPTSKAIAAALALTLSTATGFAATSASAQISPATESRLAQDLANNITTAANTSSDDTRGSSVQSAVTAFFTTGEGKGLSQAEEQQVYQDAISRLSQATVKLPRMTVGQDGQQSILVAVGSNLPASTTSTDTGNGTSGVSGGGGSTSLGTSVISGGSGSSV